MQNYRNGTFLAIALAMGSQIPTTIEKVQEPWIKVLLQLFALLVFLWAAINYDKSTAKKISVRPPPALPEKTEQEPITIPDPPIDRKSVSLLYCPVQMCKHSYPHHGPNGCTQCACPMTLNDLAVKPIIWG